MNKKIIASILILILISSLIGCGVNKKKDSTKNTSKIEIPKDKQDLMEMSEENLCNLGKKQTQAIKKVVEKYGLTTEKGKTNYCKAQLQISENEDDLLEINYNGYTVGQADYIKINDGRENKYRISYKSIYDDETKDKMFLFDISVKYGLEDFKIEQATMMKDLILALYDGNYDFNGFDNLVNNCMNDRKSWGTRSDERDVGKFKESIAAGLHFDKGYQILDYSVTLRGSNLYKKSLNKENIKINEMTSNRNSTGKMSREATLKLGKKQTQGIKNVVEKYGLTTTGIRSKDFGAQINISQNENDTSDHLSNSYKGYSAMQPWYDKVKDGRENEYKIEYDCIYNDETKETTYSFCIRMKFGSGDFKIDQATMMKDLILAFYDGNYDFNGFDEWINNCIKNKKYKVYTRDKGIYTENLIKGLFYYEGYQTLEYGVTLRK